MMNNSEYSVIRLSIIGLMFLLLVATGAVSGSVVETTDTLDYGMTVNETLGPEDAYNDRFGQHETYTFSGSKGDVITAELRQFVDETEEEEQMQLKLIDSDGNVIESTDHLQGPMSLDDELPVTGTYKIIVTGYYKEATFDYQLRLHNRLAVDDQITYGDRLNESITTQDAFSDSDYPRPDLEGYHDIYAFDGTKGDVITAELRQFVDETEEEDQMILELIDPDGNVIESTDHLQGPMSLDDELPVTGTYKIVVTSFYSHSTFDYRLSLNAEGTPTAAFDYSPSSPQVGESVSFDGSKSTDSDGSLQSYAWDIDNDGQYDDATGVTTTITFAEAGSHTVELRVTDSHGATDTVTRTISVEASNSEPSAEFNYSPSSPQVGESVTFDGSASTDSDGSVVSYQWDFGGDGTVDMISVMPQYTFTEAGEYTVTLTVADDDGATDTVTRTITVTSGDKDVAWYDPYVDEHGAVSDAGLNTAVGNYLAEELSDSDLNTIIRSYLSGTPIEDL